jgi:endonuclease/exonuclease/phosphatase family metal-dependent hydrolase
MRSCVLAAALAAWSALVANGLTVMSYNVENLFDDVHNGSEYREFDPSLGKWTTDMFLVRVDSIAEVIRKVVAGGPDIVLLQEVENENALSTLVKRGLTGMGYEYSIFVPKRDVSANVAILSKLPVAHVGSLGVGPWKSTSPMRDIVEADVTFHGHTLYVLDNHWKARTGGARQTEASRIESAGVLARRIREILSLDPSADIVAAGDMNENADEYQRVGQKYVTALMPDTERLAAGSPLSAIYLSGNARGLGADGQRLEMYEPWFELQAGSRGSYAYQGDWLTMDHMLLSAGLFDGEGFSYRWGSFAPVRLSFLLAPDGTPRSSADPRGRGYSDHLPLLMTLDVKK